MIGEHNRRTSSRRSDGPPVLGYNCVTADDDAEVFATVDGDPLLVVGDYGEGRSFAFTTSCPEHWTPAAFLEWDHLPGPLAGYPLQRGVADALRTGRDCRTNSPKR